MSTDIDLILQTVLSTDGTIIGLRDGKKTSLITDTVVGSICCAKIGKHIRLTDNDKSVDVKDAHTLQNVIKANKCLTPEKVHPFRI
jgi:hypothetical protein